MNAPPPPSDVGGTTAGLQPLGLYWQIHPATGWGLYGANMAIQLRRRAAQLGYYPVLLQAPHSLAFQATTPVNLSSSTTTTSNTGKKQPETMGAILQSLWNEQRSWRESTPQLRDYFQREAERATQPATTDTSDATKRENNIADDDEENAIRLDDPATLPSLTSSLTARFNFAVASTVVGTFDANALVR